MKELFHLQVLLNRSFQTKTHSPYTDDIIIYNGDQNQIPDHFIFGLSARNSNFLKKEMTHGANSTGEMEI